MEKKAFYTKSDQDSVDKKEMGVEVEANDKKIVSAETKDRKQEEGDGFKKIVEKEATEDTEELINTRGYTANKENLTDDAAVEPEKYVNKSKDLRAPAEGKISRGNDEEKE